jgi:hypothetical protein
MDDRDIKINSLEINQANMAEKIDVLRDTVIEGFSEVRESFRNLDGKYVSQESFWPVKTVVYGLVGFILLSVIGAVVVLIIK